MVRELAAATWVRGSSFRAHAVSSRNVGPRVLAREDRAQLPRIIMRLLVRSCTSARPGAIRGTVPASRRLRAIGKCEGIRPLPGLSASNCLDVREGDFISCDVSGRGSLSVDVDSNARFESRLCENAGSSSRRKLCGLRSRNSLPIIDPRVVCPDLLTVPSDNLLIRAKHRPRTSAEQHALDRLIEGRPFKAESIVD